MNKQKKKSIFPKVFYSSSSIFLWHILPKSYYILVGRKDGCSYLKFGVQLKINLMKVRYLQAWSEEIDRTYFTIIYHFILLQYLQLEHIEIALPNHFKPYSGQYKPETKWDMSKIMALVFPKYWPPKSIFNFRQNCVQRAWKLGSKLKISVFTWVTSL